MNKKYILILLLLFSSIFPSKLIKKTENYINSTFPESIILNGKLTINKKIKSKAENEVKQKFFRDNLYVWKITTKDSINYYAALDNVKGKSMPITFLVIFNENKSIYSSKLIKYREAYGGEVGRKSWLNQFNDYTSDSSFVVGKDIASISGATISVHSMSKGMKKLSLIVDDIINYDYE